MTLTLSAALALNLLLQVGEPTRRPAAAVQDSVAAPTAKPTLRRRLPITAEVLATAFRDEGARELFYRARKARLAHDSTLRSYDAKSRERVSIGMRVGENGRERMMYRHESASRVQWSRDVGVRAQLTGARMAIPINPKGARDELEGDLARGVHAPLPYFPGHEPLASWTGAVAQNDVNDRGLVHPLAEGSEAYYTYASGDSVRYVLPNGAVVQLREIRVRPRATQSNVAVGSLMFDISTGQLVRAAYRLAQPMDFWVNIQQQPRDSSEKPPSAALMMLGKLLVSPMKLEINEMTVSYSLHDGRYWLPRSRSFRGTQQMSFAYLTFEMEHAFSYTSVNRDEPLAPITINLPKVDTLVGSRVRAPDSLKGPAAKAWRDSVFASRDTIRKRFRDSLYATPCDSTGTRTVARELWDTGLPVAVSFPCDLDKLERSPDFTGSLFDANEEVFNLTDRDDLIARALSLAVQAPLLQGLPRPRFQYGLSMTRYNRIEGFSTGLLVEQQLGGGYVATVTGRLGAADLEPNAELSLARTNRTKTATLTGYNRLVSASDWGQPLTFGAGVSALLFGRDEGFYYRASGAELSWRHARGRGLTTEWRLFGEQQREAQLETMRSVTGRFGPNIVATKGLSAGGSLRLAHTRGLDPRGFRVSTDLRLEAAAGDSAYGRGAIETTVSRGLIRSVTGAITLAGGSTAGAVPPQRRWYLGGTHTIRGQSPDTAQSGNAFWMGRAEIGRDFPVVRATIFGDAGWVGDRAKTTEIGRPMSGAGVGLSVMDGLLRFDVARGLYPTKQTRVSLYLGGRF